MATHAYRASFLLLALVLTFLLYPGRRRQAPGVRWYDAGLALLVIGSLTFLIATYQQALQRITNPTALEVLGGTVLIALVLEATRRTTGPVLPVCAVLFLLYAYLGPYVPEPFDHRGYRLPRIVGQNYLTLEGIFGTPLDVAATFIVLFTIYGAVLEASGAGRFFLDWAFAALGRSHSSAGPGRTVTAAGFLLGTVSGSGVATTVTLGSLAWPMLRRAGFDRETGGAILASAGIGALLSPPTLGAAAFLIAEYLKVSYLQVLVMATLPMLLYYLSCLLMIEADSRRIRTRPVQPSGGSLGELTRRHGYHFLSLGVVAGLLAWGMTPFLAVFWSILLAIALSFLRAEARLAAPAAGGAAALTAALGLALGLRASVACFAGLLAMLGVCALRARRRPGQAEDSRLYLALGNGGRGVLGVAATTATAGLIVSVMTLTGLGIKISGLVVALAGGSRPATVFFAALAVWVLGLAVPVTASYVIAAVMIIPALVEVGVPEAAAHMFVFYYAVLSEVSPPTALAPFAAAAVTGGKPFRTMMLTWKYCLPAFLVPFVFTLAPDGTGLLLKGEPLAIARTFATACLAVAGLAGALGGQVRAEASPAERGLLACGSLLLLGADAWADLAGLLLLASGVALHLARLRRA